MDMSSMLQALSELKEDQALLRDVTRLIQRRMQSAQLSAAAAATTPARPVRIDEEISLRMVTVDEKVVDRVIGAMPVFNGDPTQCSYPQYARQLKYFVDVERFSARQQQTVVLHTVQGTPARLVKRTIENQRTAGIKELLEVLRETYGPRNSEMYLHTQLEALRAKDGAPVLELIENFVELLEDNFPSLTPELHQRYVWQLYAKLPESHKKRIAEKTTKFKDLDHLRELAMAVDRELEMSGAVSRNESPFAPIVVSGPTRAGPVVMRVKPKPAATSADLLPVEVDRRSFGARPLVADPENGIGPAPGRTWVARVEEAPKPRCYHCGKEGHYQRECPQRPPPQAPAAVTTGPRQQ